MSAAVADLLAAALKLSPEEQEELADQLYESLHPSDPELARLADDEYEAEMEKLADELGLPPGTTVPAERLLDYR